MSENDIIKMQMATFYRDVDLSRNYDGEDGEVKDKINEIQGIRPTGEDDMYTIYECHTYLDLEGFEDTDVQGEQTGLKLPYIVFNRQEQRRGSVYRS